MLLSLLLFLNFISFSLSASGYSYSDLTTWPDTCTTTPTSELSPINIVTASVAAQNNSNFRLKKISYSNILKIPMRTIRDQNHLDFNSQNVANNYIIIEKDEVEYKFNVVNIHIHCPSEHTFDGVKFDCEMHIVHLKEQTSNDKDPKRNLLAIGILFQSGGNPDPLLIENADIDLSTVFNVGSKFYVYNGSRTSPPCDESIMHFVSQTVRRASLEQIEALKKDILLINSTGTGNAGPMSSINNRIIMEVAYEQSSLIAISLILLLTLLSLI